MTSTTLPVPAHSTALDLRGDADAIASAFLLGYSGSTRDAYAADLRDFAAFLAPLGLDPLGVHRAHVEAYARDLEAKGRAKATVARRLSTLAGFYRYAEDESAVARSPVARVRRPRVPDDSATLGLDRAELSAFLAAAGERSPRDHALVTLLALNGLRISEALQADVDALGRERGHRTLAITRKGGRRALTPLAPRTAAAIDVMLDGREAGPLFVTRTGGRLDRRAAARTVARIARDAGITKRISPHSCRHSFVTLALDAGASLHATQDAVGHSSPVTTQRYNRARHSLDGNPTYAVAAHVAG